MVKSGLFKGKEKERGEIVKDLMKLGATEIGIEERIEWSKYKRGMAPSTGRIRIGPWMLAWCCCH
jgi:hypothetical protein